jgi:ribosome-binding protein aMBF1 (putative translation factor)
MDQSISDQDLYIQAYRKKIGCQVKESRETKGYSQEDLAVLLNVNRSTISKIESGRFAYTIDMLAKLSWILNCEFEYLTVNL